MANLFTSFLLPRLQPPCTCLRIPLQASSRSPPTAFRPKSLSKTFKNVRSTPRNRSAELWLSEGVNRFSGFFRPSHQARPNVNFKLSFAQSPLASPIGSPIWRLNFWAGSVRNYRPPQPPTYYGRAPPPSWNRPPRGRGEGIKSWLNSINPQVLLYGIIGINVAVFCLWRYAEASFQRFRDPSLLQFMVKNFTVSPKNLQEGRIWVLLTACFSHEGTAHILVNMLSLYFMAPPVLGILRNAGFLTLYLFSGVASSTISVVYHKYIEPIFSKRSVRYSTAGSHGASGAVYGILTFFAACAPNATFLLFFVVPVPAYILVPGIFAYDLYNAVRHPESSTDSAGHVGGIASGLLYYLRRVGRL